MFEDSSQSKGARTESSCCHGVPRLAHKIHPRAKGCRLAWLRRRALGFIELQLPVPLPKWCTFEDSSQSKGARTESSCCHGVPRLAHKIHPRAKGCRLAWLGRRALGFIDLQLPVPLTKWSTFEDSSQSKGARTESSCCQGLPRLAYKIHPRAKGCKLAWLGRRATCFIEFQLPVPLPKWRTFEDSSQSKGARTESSCCHGVPRLAHQIHPRAKGCRLAWLGRRALGFIELPLPMPRPKWRTDEDSSQSKGARTESSCCHGVPRLAHKIHPRAKGCRLAWLGRRALGFIDLQLPVPLTKWSTFEDSSQTPAASASSEMAYV
ncbi:uncharacterized protein LOC127478541 [Manacus candei]|uniref:uncharacterized protein LOC127478541 n=1 Tax=Manacus candei TaxID=415023 RepID=UPI00222786EA|nr:uncharacterized protein LOC127478541 [Manacus candei]